MPWDVHTEAIEGGGLTRTCTTCDDKVSRAAIEPFDPNPHHSSKASVYGSELDEVNHGERILLELSNGQGWPIRRDRRDCAVDTGTIMQSSIKNWHHTRPVTEWNVCV